ncbi:hypothetical protein [Oleidesulfovibrio sp.]|uniref:phage fiber-tail adaptor protein n=1 Tax=Oleidesulfovibrio sp. TaxID=2909707 RepID=UPI003A89E420
MHRYLEWPEKLSGERLDYTIDMSSRLEAEEYIQSVTWKCGSPLVLESQRQDVALLTAVLSGGEPGRRHAVEVLATTSQGRMVGERVMLLVG